METTNAVTMADTSLQAFSRHQNHRSSSGPPVPAPVASSNFQAASIEAMTKLAVHWRFHRRAAPMLKRGGKHKDKRMREAAGSHARLREDERDPRLRVMI